MQPRTCDGLVKHPARGRGACHDGDTATGVAYCQVKHVSEEDGHEVLTDSSVRYDDRYIRRDGRWYIATRIARFTVIDKRTLQS